ncbi:hypothetical protein SOVF_213450 [Spinacia oleracea]|nr:hypothetical protein SOVF_213450 [Spinacia oleracea]
MKIIQFGNQTRNFFKFFIPYARELHKSTNGGTRRRNGSSNLCMPGSSDPSFVKGKVVLCDRGVNARVVKGEVVKEAGGVGMILANTAASGEELVTHSHLIPTVAVGMKVGDVIRVYVWSSDKKATTVLSFGGTVLNVWSTGRRRWWRRLALVVGYGNAANHEA